MTKPTGIEPALLKHMIPGFWFYRVSGKDTWGNRTYERAVPFVARWMNKSENKGRSGIDLSDPTGSPVPDHPEILLVDADLRVAAFDKITTPDGRTMYVVDVVTTYDERGPYYQTITLEEKKR